MGIISSAMLHSWEEMGWLDNDNSEELEQLKAENERLKKEIKELAHYLACMTEQRNKANTCLQEIKEVCDYENEYYSIGIDDYKKMIKDIIDIITKAESMDKR